MSQVINELDGPQITAFLISPKTFPHGLWIKGHEFSDSGRPSTIQRASDVQDFEIEVLDGQTKRLSRGAAFAFNLEPDCEAARNTALLPLSEHNGTSRTSITRVAGGEKVAATVYLPDGSELDMAGGAVIGKRISATNHQFVVLFSDLYKE